MKVALPSGPFACVVADPPWDYRAGKASRIRPKYSTMTLEEIRALPVAAIAAEESMLFLWVTSGFLEEGFRVMRAWGFTYKATAEWVKGRIEEGRLILHQGMGSYVANAHEHVLIGSRGGVTARVKMLPSVVLAPSRGKVGGGHSVKPQELYNRAAQIAPMGRRLEMFARSYRVGWVGWGLEAAGSPAAPAEVAAP